MDNNFEKSHELRTRWLMSKERERAPSHLYLKTNSSIGKTGLPTGWEDGEEKIEFK